MYAVLIEILSYHHEVCWLLAILCLLLAVAGAFFPIPKSRLVLLSLLLFALSVLWVLRFEKHWHELNGKMYSSYRSGRADVALSTAKELLEIARKNYPKESIRTIESVHHVAWIMVNTGRFQEAEPYLEESIRGYVKTNEVLPDNSPLVCGHGVGNEKSLLGVVYEQTQRKNLAEPLYTQALEHYKKRCPEFPEYQKEMEDALQHLHKSMLP